MNLSELKPPKGAHKKGRRVGRGPGSGRGKTSGKGHKGQLARSGAKHRPWMEGGQMRIYRRLPKRGFYNPAHVEYQVLNLSDLAEANLSDRVDIDGLLALRLVRTKTNPVKILGNGTIDRPLHIVAHAFSKSAEEKITAAGGKCELINPPKIVEPAKRSKAKKPAPAADAADTGTHADSEDTQS